MLLKVVRQPPGNPKRVPVWESRWEMPEGFRKASEQFLKGIGKLL
jgi:hypothetical protein